MAKAKEFTGKDKMLEDWNRVMIAIIRAGTGSSDVKHKRNEDDAIVGVTAEIEVGFNDAVSEALLGNYEDAIKAAQDQMVNLVVKEGEFTSKQRLLIDWMSMKNSIVLANAGEMKVGVHRNKGAGGVIVGLTAEIDLDFSDPLPEIFSDEEKELIDKAKENPKSE